jgi:hypothetical protein
VIRALVVLLAASALSAGTVLAQRPPERLVNYRNLPVATASGGAPEAAQVKQAILAAATVDPLWKVAGDTGGRLLATRSWREHSITVEIRYSRERYSLVYRDSTNMKYAPRMDGDSRDRNSARYGVPRTIGPVIHPFYNRYVGELKEAIRAELQKL